MAMEQVQSIIRNVRSRVKSTVANVKGRAGFAGEEGFSAMRNAEGGVMKKLQSRARSITTQFRLPQLWMRGEELSGEEGLSGEGLVDALRGGRLLGRLRRRLRDLRGEEFGGELFGQSKNIEVSGGRRATVKPSKHMSISVVD